MLWWIIGGALIVLVVVLATMRRRGAGLTSIVLMQPAPRALSETALRDVAKWVFKGDGDVIQIPRDDLPPGMAAGYAISLNGGPVLYIINAHRPSARRSICRTALASSSEAMSNIIKPSKPRTGPTSSPPPASTGP